MKRQRLGLIVLLMAGLASTATADATTDQWGGPNDDRYGSSKPALTRDWGGGRVCETERGACPISAPKPLGSICTCSISGGVVPGYVRW